MKYFTSATWPPTLPSPASHCMHTEWHMNAKSYFDANDVDVCSATAAAAATVLVCVLKMYKMREFRSHEKIKATAMAEEQFGVRTEHTRHAASTTIKFMASFSAYRNTSRILHSWCTRNPNCRHVQRSLSMRPIANLCWYLDERSMRWAEIEIERREHDGGGMRWGKQNEIKEWKQRDYYYIFNFVRSPVSLHPANLLVQSTSKS